MKNGFTYQGTELEALIGSYGRVQSSLQSGVQNGNFSAYAAFDAAYDKGWRDFSSSSHLNRMYVDVGARNDQTEFHVNFTGADNVLGAVVATPVELLNQKWSSVWTWPQSTHLQLAFLNTSLSHSFSDTLSFQGNAYYRGFWQSHVDGNGTDAHPCFQDAASRDLRLSVLAEIVRAAADRVPDRRQLACYQRRILHAAYSHCHIEPFSD
jgi:iron complex outermembrane recepter protein